MFKFIENKPGGVLLALSLLLSACGGGSDSTGNLSLNSAGSVSNSLQSFLPTTNNPPSAQEIAIQKEGARLNSQELAQIASTGVLPAPFNGPLLSGAENSSASVTPQPQMKAAVSAPSSSLTPAYRFYNTKSSGHFFTTSTAERDNVIANLPFLSYEGPAFLTSSTNVNGLSPVHRFYNTQTGVHLYTISEAERANVAANLPTFKYEGIAYYASTVAGTSLSPLYRFYFPSKGFHFYTISVSERDNIIANLPSYTYEGIGYYVLNSDWQPNVANVAPVANAGSSRNVYTGTLVTLDGSGSSDANGDPLTYSWTGAKPVGISATLSGVNTVAPSFTADIAGSYVITLVVNDGKVNSAPASVTITASAPPPPAVSLFLYSGETTPVYIGCVTCNQFQAESICNKFGTYGSGFSSLSIWNQFGTYGSQFSAYSPWNQFSSYGPAIIGSDYLFYGYFTVNNFRLNRTTNQSFVNVLNYYSSTNNLALTRTYACGN